MEGRQALLKSVRVGPLFQMTRFSKCQGYRYYHCFPLSLVNSGRNVGRNFCSCSSYAFTPNHYRGKLIDSGSNKTSFLSGQNGRHNNLSKRYYTNRNILSLRERGLISDLFPAKEDEFRNLCTGKPQTIYAGFDPTADSLHVGNLAILMLLLQCQRAGHRPIALIGGATGMIGDPSGKNTERPTLDQDYVAQNAKKLVKNITTVFQNHEHLFWDDKGGKEALPQCIIVNNLDWYKNMSSVEFFGKLGRHFRLGQMIMRQSVQSRMNSEEGISFTEFSYQVFQSYDWYHLLNQFNCRIQLGGHDQMGNIVSGQDYISRALKKRVYGLTVPLITSESGDKYGKSAGNAVWLDSIKTSPFELYQFFLRTKDAEVERMLKIFTFKTEDEIAGIMRKQVANPENRIAQQVLATDVTRLVHGDLGYQSALKTTGILYSEDLDALASLPFSEVKNIFKGAAASFSEIYLEPGTTILQMALKGKCFANERDAMRIMNAGGFSLNYRKISNYDEVIVPGIHILPNKISLARVGKRNYYIIKWNP